VSQSPSLKDQIWNRFLVWLSATAYSMGGRLHYPQPEYALCRRDGDPRDYQDTKSTTKFF